MDFEQPNLYSPLKVPTSVEQMNGCEWIVNQVPNEPCSL